MYNSKIPEYPELLAELQLATYFPNITEWVADCKNDFRRNYFNDLSACKPNQCKAILSRNGIFEVLPERLFFKENIIPFRDRRDFEDLVNKLKTRKKHYKGFFLPFDSILFNYSLRLSEKVTELIGDKNKLLLQRIFDYNIDTEANPYIRLLAPLLLQATALRGDFIKLTRILTTIIGCKVDYNIKQNETVQFTIHKLNLNSTEYHEFNEILKPFFVFFEYWFLPMELNCTFKVKDYQQPFVLSDSKPLVLDYNTKLS